MARSNWKTIIGTVLGLGWFAVCAPTPASGSRDLESQVDGFVGIPGEPSAEGLEFEGKARAERARPRRADLGSPVALHLELEPLDGNLSQETGGDGIGRRRVVGSHRRLPAEWSVPIRGKDLAWEAVPGGGEVATVALTSPGARSLRLAIAFESLPDDAEVRFYAPGNPSDANGPFEASFLLPEPSKKEKKSANGDRFWSPVIHGDSIAMEIFVPAWKVGQDVVFVVDRVSHIDQSLEPGSALDPGDSGSCNRNLSCSPKWQQSGDAVAMYVFESGVFTVQCTGQLIVDGEPDTQKPWFLTAAHCLMTKAEAKSMTFFFFYQQAGCNGGSFPMDQTAGGAKLKATTGGGGLTEGDHTLVLLKKKPPAGATFQGIAIAGDFVGSKKGASIGHPRGDHKKIALLKKIDQTAGVTADGTVFEPGFSHYVVRWKKKTVTDEGSSGSSLMVGKNWPNQFAIGVLTGGFSSCDDTKAPDFYGSLPYVLENFPKFGKRLGLD